MNAATRYTILVVVIIVTFHYILRIAHDGYGRATSLESINAALGRKGDAPVTTSSSSAIPSPTPTVFPSYNLVNNTCNYDHQLQSYYHTRRANASVVILARNNDINELVKSIREFEDRFNMKYNYPYTFLNDEEFTDEFKDRVGVLSQAKMEFGVIPREHWVQPDWIDEEKATEARNNLTQESVPYAGSVPYRNMCRFNSGFFYKHPLLQKYRWYWRIEPDVHFLCDVNFDPFLYLEDHNKVYGFTITLYEFAKTIPTLWDATKEFMQKYPQYISENNAMGWLSDNGGQDYNNCHFWSNFEIADMDFWRGEAYQSYFDFLDAKGGFYYERWGDAPVHSIGVGLLARKDQIHFFDPIGYEHNPNQHCPKSEEVWTKARCRCNMDSSFDDDYWNSCLRHWKRIWDPE